MSKTQDFEIKETAGSGPKGDAPENDDALPQHNGEEYDPNNWDAWEANPDHANDSWIYYRDNPADPNTGHRVPVWYYFTLGL